jgi:glycosyltransferase involved in cell wall biosynthesis
MKAQLIRLGVPENKVYHNPYGVDMSLFAAAAPADNPPIFLAVGRFVNKKAPYLTLMAFSEVAKCVPEARLTMVGSGELMEPCQRLARVLGIADAVDFRGICSHIEVAALMQASRAFVQHSVQAFNGDSEGTPVAILEASASGLPVISTRHAGIPDVVVDGETGILVDEGDVNGMTRAMVLLAKDSQLASRMGQAARQRIEAYFSMEKSIGNLWVIIDAAIEGHKNVSC